MCGDPDLTKNLNSSMQHRIFCNEKRKVGRDRKWLEKNPVEPRPYLEFFSDDCIMIGGNPEPDISWLKNQKIS
jgi:Uma2 family endonuclease